MIFDFLSRKPTKKDRQILEILYEHPPITPIDLSKILNVGVASIYPNLHRLKKLKMVDRFEGTELIPERGNRPRVYYQITLKGMEFLGI